MATSSQTRQSQLTALVTSSRIRSWKVRQGQLNQFVKRTRLLGVAPLRVDGVPGPATRRRIKEVKWWIGYAQRTTAFDAAFHNRLLHPFSRKFSNDATLRQGAARRHEHNRAWRKNHVASGKTEGVIRFDGVPVAAWLVPYLQWARDHGWSGRLVSGWRDPNYSERLCYNMCGAPRCPGKCAGRSSNHSGSVKPRGAVDVTDYYTFARLMTRCPYSPRLYNRLGRADPVHFSATGN